MKRNVSRKTIFKPTPLPPVLEINSSLEITWPKQDIVEPREEVADVQRYLRWADEALKSDSPDEPQNLKKVA